ncbi:UbiA family prenyltransferase [Saprospiraceae bacterium]|jgi:4-hydroxybenzoate polyprenyltransferase|nr:UbiA family prenyltransferase [Saprospiraceae bacterium]
MGGKKCANAIRKYGWALKSFRVILRTKNATIKFLIKFIDLIFYSNLWIALCALALTWQTQLLLTKEMTWSPVIGMTFCSTLFLYALHRIVGLVKVQQFTNAGRYKVISTFKNHIIIYAFLAGFGSAYYFFRSNLNVQLALIIPALISLAYVLPFLNGKRRLRDLGIIKIFLIAIVWAWVTVVLPSLEMNEFNDPAVWIMAVERALFIFAITLPFDIRDLKVDAHNQVSTIPSKIGILKTKRLGMFVLIGMVILVQINYQIGFYVKPVSFALLLSIISTYYLIQNSDKNQHDYYFTGAMDGTMIFQFLLVWGAFVLYPI